MQFVSKFAWNVKSYFRGTIRKNISICLLLKLFTQHAKRYDVDYVSVCITPDKRVYQEKDIPGKYFSYLSTKTYIVGTH